MGIDCAGLKPVNKTGEYFHNTIWAWPDEITVSAPFLRALAA